VGDKKRKPVIGILGGVGSGKSTAAAEFARLGCAVIDADEIAHELLEEDQIKGEVVSLFSSEVLNENGTIDRGRLAGIVFSDGGKLLLLNKLIHPGVLARAQQLIEEYQKEPSVKAIVLDMPLLMEVGWDKHCDKLIFVKCDFANRLKRAGKLEIFNENQLKIRENFQISLDNKRRIAENTLDNNSGLLALSRQINVLFGKIAAGF